MSDMKEFISWRTAQNAANRKFKEKRQQQAVYFLPGRMYKHMPYALWKIRKPGTLAYYIREPGSALDGLFRKTELCKTG